MRLSGTKVNTAAIILINRTLIITIVMLLSVVYPTWCNPLRLNLPIQCIPGKNCFIQNYFDHDTDFGYADYRCGFLSYDGHTGTDFRVRDLVSMRGKVAVLAAASGSVVGTRDTEPDQNVRERGKKNLKGKDAGNGVRISHGEGWETQYSHLMSGSILVQVGQRVKQGDVLGFVGLSGNTEFPHVELIVRKDGRPIDPFAPDQTTCGNSPSSLWSETALSLLSYIPTGVLISGFATSPLTREQAEAGDYVTDSFPVSADSLVYWIELFGAQKDDRLSFELVGPNKQRLLIRYETVSGNKAVLFHLAGKRRGASSWLKGKYTANFQLYRNAKLLIEDQRIIEAR